MVWRLALLLAIFLQAGTEVSPQASGEFQKVRYVLPEDFHGWACADFGVAGAPPLNRDSQGIFEVAVIASGIVATSSLPNLTHISAKVFRMDRGQLREVEQDELQERSEYSTTASLSRHCFFAGSAEASRAIMRPPTLHESNTGVGAVSRTFELSVGGLCDLRDWSRVCIDATAGQGDISDAIALGTRGNSHTKIGRCGAFDGLVVRYRYGRGSRLSLGEIQRHGQRGTEALATWTDDHGTATEVAERFERDLTEFIKETAARCYK